MKQAKMRRVIEIAIASPGDVKEERKAVSDVFNRWNSAHHEAFLHPVMWEFAATPALGDHPQHILNSQIIEKSDLLLAIFWSKLGTPTPTASSGTAEEIREFIKRRGPQRVMVYFCTRPLPYDIDAADLVKLRDFKTQMRSQGLFHEYEQIEDFERDLYYHLDQKVDDLLSDKLPLPETPDPRSKSDAVDTKPADARLHQTTDFGTTLSAIAQGFSARMREFEALDGVGPNKYYALGAHVYASAAFCLDRYLTYSAGGLSATERGALDRLAGRLKRLAAEIPDKNADFRQYWADGGEIAKDLTAHVAMLGRWKR